MNEPDTTFVSCEDAAEVAYDQAHHFLAEAGCGGCELSYAAQAISEPDNLVSNWPSENIPVTQWFERDGDGGYTTIAVAKCSTCAEGHREEGSAFQPEMIRKEYKRMKRAGELS